MTRHALILTVISFLAVICSGREITFGSVAYSEVKDMQKDVPVYRFDDDITGEFLGRFCDTIAALNCDADVVVLSAPQSSEKSWLDGDLNEYLSMFIQWF